MRTTKFVAAVAAAIALVSCGTKSVPEKLDAFVDDAETKGAAYSETQWQQSEIKYQQLVNEYLDSESEYSDTEKKQAAEAMGRYHALLIRNGVEQVGSFIEELGQVLPSYLEGLASGLGESSANLESSLESLFNDEKLEKSLDDLGNALEGIFGGLDDEDDVDEDDENDMD